VSGRGSAGDLAVGGRFVQRPEAEQGLEGGHRCASAVVAEDELVEVDLQVLGRHATVGALSQVFRFEAARWARGRSFWASV
jgi:hypothetical protein